MTSDLDIYRSGQEKAWVAPQGITSERDLKRNSFLLKRLVDTKDFDGDECRRVLVQFFIEDIIDHLLDEGVLDYTVDHSVITLHATRSLEGPPKLSLVPPGPS